MGKCHLWFDVEHHNHHLCNGVLDIHWTISPEVFALIRRDNQCTACKRKHGRKVRKESGL